MIKRTLYFGNPAYINVSNSQLCIRQLTNSNEKAESIATVPIEDIGIVIFDHYQLTITQAVFESLLDNNAAILTCNNSHHPHGLMLPVSGNVLQNERYREQLVASEPLKKQLWAQTIMQKIKNQYSVLQKSGINADYLVPLYKNVKSGDTGNCEATAAAFYWKSIFPHLSDFRRFREGPPPNNLLNYAYAILRATMARSIVAAGLLPTLGIHHHNRYNAYCLADDLMEPFRPYVDRLVKNIIIEQGISKEIKKDAKINLMKIPAMDVLIDGETSPLMIASQRTAVSLVKCFSGEARKILYPNLE